MIRTTASNRSPSESSRAQTLGRILPLWPHEVVDLSLAGQVRICRLLGSALRRERQRGIAGHWAYDIGRHAALARAHGPELRRLAALRAKMKMPAVEAGMQANEH